MQLSSGRLGNLMGELTADRFMHAVVDKGERDATKLKFAENKLGSWHRAFFATEISIPRVPFSV